MVALLSPTTPRVARAPFTDSFSRLRVYRTFGGTLSMPFRFGAVLASYDAIGWSRPGLRSTPQCRCYAHATSDRRMDPVVCIPTGQIFR